MQPVFAVFLALMLAAALAVPIIGEDATGQSAKLPHNVKYHLTGPLRVCAFFLFFSV